LFKILMLDDDSDLRRMFSRALVKKQCDVFMASNLDQARTYLNEHVFDVFVCDMMVGDELGLDLLREVYGKLAELRTLIIVLSGNPEHFAACRELGIEIILSKPVVPSSLIGVVENYVAERFGS
jgi:DNA-binding NtrC family response regulator